MRDPHEDAAEDAQLNRAIEAMRSIEVDAIPKEVIEGTRGALASGHLAEQVSSRLRPRLNSKQAWSVALLAATILVAVGVFSQMNATSAFAEVARQVKSTKTLRAVVVDPREGGTLFVSGTRRRFEGGGAVVIADSKSDSELMLDTESKLAYRTPVRGMALDFYGLFQEMASAATKPTKEYVDKDGKRFSGLAGKAKLETGGGIWAVEVKVWSDATTNLPVRLEIRSSETNEAPLIVEQLEFGLALDDELFDMKLPKGYELVGLAANKLGPPPTDEEAAKLTIVPGVGVGKVKFGMSRDEIVAVLGEPDSTLHGAYLNYASLGLQVILVGREPDKLGMIIANPDDAGSLNRHDFRGKTAEGIGIGSSQPDLAEAYGMPPSFRDRVATYEKLGISFSFTNEKISQITMERNQ
jgi:hypothetical protein